MSGRLRRLLWLIAAAVVGIAVAYVVTSPDVDELRSRLRCGLSRQEVTALAKKHGLGTCTEPTEKVGTPDYGCHGRDVWVAFWFDHDRLVSYAYGTTEDSGTMLGSVRLCGEVERRPEFLR